MLPVMCLERVSPSGLPPRLFLPVLRCDYQPQEKATSDANGTGTTPTPYAPFFLQRFAGIRDVLGFTSQGFQAIPEQIRYISTRLF